MKKIFLVVVCQLCLLTFRSQTVYTNNFDNLSLQTYTTGSSSTTFTNVPPGFTLINDGWINNPGSLTNPNRPFQVPDLVTTGWAVLYNPAENDTFLVSTSWLDTTGIYADRWVLTPPISNIAPNTVLTWLAKSPDPSFPEGYEVYGTTNAAASSPQDFSLGDRLFALADGNTPGGGEMASWNRRSISIGAFAGQTLRFAFRDESKDMYQIWIDDIAVMTLPNSLDGALSSPISKKYILSNTADSVETTFTNQGASMISSITLAYQVGNSSLNTELFSFVNPLGYGESSLIKFSLPYAVSQPSCYPVTSWIVSINGQTDQVPANNTASYSVTVQNTTPRRALLFEQFISANNGDGPDAQEKGRALQADSSIIVVNIHDQDSLREPNSAALLTDYKTDYATAMVNRRYFSDAGAVAATRPFYNDHVIAAQKDSVTPVSVSIINMLFNPINRKLSFTVKADFVGEVTGDYRLNAYLTENQVGALLIPGGPVNDSTVNGYNQWNNSYDVPFSPYYQLGAYSDIAGTYILPYPTYRHENTLVYAFEGAYRNSGLIPTTGGTQGQSYQQNDSLVIPAPKQGVFKFYPDNLYIVAFAAEYGSDKNDRRVLNVARQKITGNPEFVGIRQLSLSAGLSIYPNPSEGLFYLKSADMGKSYSIRVYDVFGKCVQSLDLVGGQSLRLMDLSMLDNGVYFLKIASDGQYFTEKVIVQKDHN